MLLLYFNGVNEKNGKDVFRNYLVYESSTCGQSAAELLIYLYKIFFLTETFQIKKAKNL